MVHGSLDVLLQIQEYHDDLTNTHDQAKIRLSARVWGPVYPLTQKHLLYLCLVYPFSAACTVPRIMYQAAQLAFQKKLKVYQRPTPISRALSEKGTTVVRKIPDAFQKLCIKVVLEHLHQQCLVNGHSLILDFPDCVIAKIAWTCISFLDNVHLDKTQLRLFTKTYPESLTRVQIHSPQFFVRLFRASALPQALCISFIRGDAYFDVALVRLLARNKGSIEKTPTRLQGWFARDDGLSIRAHPESLQVIQWPRHQTWTIVLGLLSMYLEQQWFQSMTRFAINPFETAQRAQGYHARLYGQPSQEKIHKQEQDLFQEFYSFWPCTQDPNQRI